MMMAFELTCICFFFSIISLILALTLTYGLTKITFISEIFMHIHDMFLYVGIGCFLIFEYYRYNIYV